MRATNNRMKKGAWLELSSKRRDDCRRVGWVRDWGIMKGEVDKGGGRESWITKVNI